MSRKFLVFMKCSWGSFLRVQIDFGLHETPHQDFSHPKVVDKVQAFF
jgi:hypothetical protein